MVKQYRPRMDHGSGSVRVARLADGKVKPRATTDLGCSV
jgi:hypothetical protein